MTLLRRTGLALLLATLALAGCRTLPPPVAAPPRPPKPPVAPDLETWLNSLYTPPPGYRVCNPRPLEQVIADVIALHDKNGGATYNFHYGDLAGHKLYAVSPFPELGEVVTGKAISADLLRAFINNRKAIWQDVRCNVGTWYDGKSQTYLDISVALANKADAVALGKRFNQIAIFDLYAMEEIPTGGTGKVLKGWPPPEERLPGIPAVNFVFPPPSEPSRAPVPAS